QRPAVVGHSFGIGLTDLQARPQPAVPSATGQWSQAAAALDDDGAADFSSGDSPVVSSTLGSGPVPSDSPVDSLPQRSEPGPTDSLPERTDNASAPPSGGATPSPQTGLADEPAIDRWQQGRTQRFAHRATAQFVRKPPSFRPRVADAFAAAP